MIKTPTRIRLSLALLLLVCAGLLLVREYGYTPAVVDQHSMQPTLQPGDRLLVKKWHQQGQIPPRGAVVVFEDPRDDGWAVKRVVGVPEDVLMFTRRGLWRNGELLREPYAQTYGGEVMGPIWVAPHLVFMAGDNRGQSQDSRDYGPVPQDRIVGVVTRVLWPPQRARRLGRGGRVNTREVDPVAWREKHAGLDPARAGG